MASEEYVYGHQVGEREAGITTGLCHPADTNGSLAAGNLRGLMPRRNLSAQEFNHCNRMVLPNSGYYSEVVRFHRTWSIGVQSNVAANKCEAQQDVTHHDQIW